MAPPLIEKTTAISPRFLPLRPEHGAGGRRGEELDQRLCRRRVLRAHADAGMEDGVVLQFGGQRPQHFDAGGDHQFVDEDDAELRLYAPGVRMSGRGAPFLVPMPTPERAMAGRDAASILPCFARSSIPAAGRTARSKASPASIWRFKAVARPKEMTSLWPVSRSKAGASSCSASLTPLEAMTLISAARIEAMVDNTASPTSAVSSVFI